jgi:hypothetical protein
MISIDSKNAYGVGNYVNICLAQLNNWKKLRLRADRAVQMLEEEVLPFYL